MGVLARLLILIRRISMADSKKPTKPSLDEVMKTAPQLDEREVSQYATPLPGMRYCGEGAGVAVFVIKNGFVHLLAAVVRQFLLLDWNCNLFLLACREKQLEIIKAWPTIQLNDHGWTYGFDTALRTGDSELIKWFEGQVTFNTATIQDILDGRAYDSRNTHLRAWIAKKKTV